MCLSNFLLRLLFVVVLGIRSALLLDLFAALFWLLELEASESSHSLTAAVNVSSGHTLGNLDLNVALMK